MNKLSDGAYHKVRTAPPTRPDGCPVNRDFTPFNDHYLRDPYPELERLSGEQPLFWSEKLGALVLTRMQDLLDVFAHHEIYSSENVQDPVFALCGRATQILGSGNFNPVAVMSNRQQPDHARIRKYTREGFSGQRMRALEPYIRRRSDELIDAMLDAGGPAEFVAAFGHPLPGQIIFRLIGFPESDDEQIMRWCSNRLAFTWGKPGDDEQASIAGNMVQYWQYCTRFVAMRHTERADDLTSELLAAHDADPQDLTYREVESIIYGLSFAGHEIVSNFLGNTLLNLLARREDWAAICNAPDLIPNALEEVLRHDSPQTSWRRVTLVDTRIGGIDIPAGTPVFLSLGAANHEQAEFEAPSSFDLHRDNARKHISFGYGIHFCLGARLARLEARIALEALSRRIPSLRLVEDQELRYSPNITFRGPAELFVDWDR
ncbi:MAG: cytochrome P450 [Gammaproteobacteria bacterium]|jgi:cytochrome P450